MPLKNLPFTGNIAHGVHGYTYDMPAEYDRLVPTGLRTLDDPYTQMANNQSLGEIWGRGALNSVKSFVGMFTHMVGSNDPSQIIGALSDTERSYSNGIQDIATDILNSQEPIYQKNNGQLNLSDPRWWAGVFMPGIAGLGGIITEGLGEAALIEAATEGAGTALAGAKIAKTAEALVEGMSLFKQANKARMGFIASQAYSGVKESLIESNDAFQTTFEEFTARGYSNEEATKHASEAAAYTFRGNVYWKVLLNSLEASAITYSPIKGIHTNGTWIDKALDSIKSPLLQGFVRNGVIEMGGEGFEEGLQSIVQGKAKDFAYENAGIADYSNTNRMLYHMSQPDFLNSVVIGAAGGGINVGAGALYKATHKNPFNEAFEKETAGIVLDKVRELQALVADPEITTQKQARINELRNDINNTGVLRKLVTGHLADQKGGEELYNEHVDFLKQTLQAAQQGNLDKMKEINQTNDPVATAELVKQTFPKLIQDSEKLKSLFFDEAKKNNNDLRAAAVIARMRFEHENNLLDLGKVSQDLAMGYDQDLKSLGYNTEAMALYEHLMKIKSLNTKIALLEYANDQKDLKKERVQSNQKLIEKYQGELIELEKQKPDYEFTADDVARLGINDNIQTLERLHVIKANLDIYNDILEENINNWRNKEWREEEYQKDVVERIKQAKDAHDAEVKAAQHPSEAAEQEVNKKKQQESVKPPVKVDPAKTTQAASNIVNNVPPTIDDLEVQIGDPEGLQKEVERQSNLIPEIGKSTADEKDQANITTERDKGTATDLHEVVINTRPVTKTKAKKSMVSKSPVIVESKNNPIDPKEKSKALRAVLRFIRDHDIDKLESFKDKTYTLDDLIATMSLAENYGMEQTKALFGAVALGWNEFAKNNGFDTYSNKELAELYHDYFSEEPAVIGSTIAEVEQSNERQVNQVGDKGSQNGRLLNTVSRLVFKNTPTYEYDPETDELITVWNKESHDSLKSILGSIIYSTTHDNLALDRSDLYMVGKQLYAAVLENPDNTRTTMYWSPKYTSDNLLLGLPMQVVGMKDKNGKVIEGALLFKYLVQGVNLIVNDTFVKNEDGKMRLDPSKTTSVFVQLSEEEYWEKIPMALYDPDRKDGSPIGFLHEAAWVDGPRYSDLSSEQKQLIRNEIQTTRNEVRHNSDNRSQLVISSIDDHKFDVIPNLDGQHPVKLIEVSPNGAKHIALPAIKFSTGGNHFTVNGKRVPYTQIINRDAIETEYDEQGNKNPNFVDEGLLVLLYPNTEDASGNMRYVAKKVAPIKTVGELDNEDFGDRDRIISSITTAIWTYLNRDQHENVSVSGYKLNTLRGLTDYLRLFINIDHPQSPLFMDEHKTLSFRNEDGDKFSIHGKSPKNLFMEHWDDLEDYLRTIILPATPLSRYGKGLDTNIPVQFLTTNESGTPVVENGYRTYSDYLRTKLMTTTVEINVGTESDPFYTIFAQRTVELRRNGESVTRTMETERIQEQVTAQQKKIETTLQQNLAGVTRVKNKKSMMNDEVTPVDSTTIVVAKSNETPTTESEEFVAITTVPEVPPALSLDDADYAQVVDAFGAIAGVIAIEERKVKVLNDLFVAKPSLSPTVITDDLKTKLRESINGIDGLLPSEQAQLVNYIFAKMMHTVISDYSDAYSKKKLQDAVVAEIRNYSNELNDKLKEHYENLQRLVEQEPVLLPLLHDYESVFEKINILSDADNENLIVQNIEDRLDSFKYYQKNADNQMLFDTEVEERSIKRSISFKMKKFIYGIPDIDKNGNIKTGFLGTVVYVNPDQVYDNVMRLLAKNRRMINEQNKTEYDVLLDTLADNVDKYKWMSKFIEQLQDKVNRDKTFKNLFVSEMNNYVFNMKIGMYSQTDENEYSMTFADVNKNEKKNKLVELWNSNLVERFSYIDYSSNVEFWDPEKIESVYKELIVDFDRIKNGVGKKATTKITAEEIQTVFGKVGIELSIDMINDWMTRGVTITKSSGKRTRVSLLAAMENSNFIFKYLINPAKEKDHAAPRGQFDKILYYAKQGNQVAVDKTAGIGNVSFNNIPMYDLAYQQAGYTNDGMTLQWRDGKNSVFGITQSTKSREITTKLKNGDVKFIQQLQRTHFGGGSLLLPLFLKDMSDFSEKYDVGRLPKTILKQLGSKFAKEKGITKLSEGDQYLFRAIAFFSQNGTIQNSTESLDKEDGSKLEIGRRLSGMTDFTVGGKSNTSYVMTAVFDLMTSHFYKKDGKIVPERAITKLLYNSIIRPELNRVIAHTAIVDEINQQDYHPENVYSFDFVNHLKTENGSSVIEIIRELSKVEANRNLVDPSTMIPENIQQLIMDMLETEIAAEVERVIAKWEEFNIVYTTKESVGGQNEASLEHKHLVVDKKYLRRKFKKDEISENDRITYAAYDFVINYFLHYNEMQKLYMGDPAAYYKKNMQGTLDNLVKRTTNLNAPGKKLADAENNQYRQLNALDKETFQGKFYQFLKEKYSEEEIAELYEKIKDSDSQEYMTLNEFLYNLRQLGNIDEVIPNVTNEEIDQAEAIATSNKSYEQLTVREQTVLKKVFQPVMKPVYSGQIYDAKHRMMRDVYIKSSAFTLVKQLTAGFEIDKIRLAMEEIETRSGHTVRLSYQSANKVGALADAPQLYHEDSTIDDGMLADLVENYETRTLLLDREHYRIQQDIPYKSGKTKFDTITMTTQLMRLWMSSGGIDIDNYIDETGAKVDGKTLYTRMMNIFGEMVKDRVQQFRKEFGIDEFGNVDETRKAQALESFKKILLSETKGFSKQDVDILTDLSDDLEFNNPLWLLNVSDKLQAILHAVVTNRIAKFSFHGYSYVAASDAGFKIQNNLDGIDQSRIVHTRPPQSGNSLGHNEIYISPKFRNPETGKLIDLIEDGFAERITDEPTGRQYWMVKNIDPELLKAITVRIPTSGYPSVSLDNIAGFLDVKSGDIMVVAGSKTVQKGEDFDADKEYTYFYTTEIVNRERVHEDERKEIVKEIVKMRKKQDMPPEARELLMKNHIVEILQAVFSHNEIQKKMFGVISTADAERNANAIYNLMHENQNEYASSPYAISYQIEQMISDASAKTGVGAFSLDVVTQAVLENLKSLGHGLILREPDTGTETLTYSAIEVTIGEYTSNGVLGNINTLDGKRTIPEVLSEIQNANLDNASVKVIGKVNINEHTFSFLKTLMLLGFDKGPAVGVEQIDNKNFLLLSQPILRDYVHEMNKLDSELTEFVSRKDKEKHVVAKLREKYKKTLTFEGNVLTNETLYKQLGEQMDNDVQNAVLDVFVKLKSYGETLQKIQTSLNVDSKGLDISFVDTILARQQLLDLAQDDNIDNQVIYNLNKMVGEFAIDKEDDPKYLYIGNGYYVKPTTLSGIFVSNALTNAYHFIGKHFPYENSALLDVIKTVYGNTFTSDQARDIIDEFIKFIYTNPELGIFNNENASDARTRLTRDVKNKHMSLARYLKSILDETSELHVYNKLISENKLLRALTYNVHFDGEASTILFNNTVDELFTEEEYYNAFVNLMINDIELPAFNGENYSSAMLYQDMVKYAFSEGGKQEATQFVKFVSNIYLKHIGFIKNLNMFSDRIKNDQLDATIMQRFKDQLMSHYPNYGVKYGKKEFSKLLVNSKLYKGNIFDYALVELDINTDAAEPYISVYDPKSVKRYHVYKLVGSIEVGDKYTKVYQKLPFLGQANMSEYDYTRDYPESLTLANRVQKKTMTGEQKTPKKLIMPESLKSFYRGELPVSAVTTKKEQAVTGKSTSLANHLFDISKNQQYKGFGLVALDLLKSSAIMKRLERVKLEYDDLDANGMYADDVITLNKNLQFGTEPFTKALLHEVLHSLIDEKIDTYFRFNKLLDYDSAPAYMKRLAELFEQTRKNIAPERLAIMLKESESDKLSQESDKIYGAKNLKEFITEAMTNTVFMDTLNRVKSDSGKSLFEHFLEFVNKVLNAFGVKINDDSILREVLSVSMQVVNADDKIIVAQQAKENNQELESIEASTKQGFRELNVLPWEEEENQKLIDDLLSKASFTHADLPENVRDTYSEFEDEEGNQFCK